jgi:3-deoxy-manno-octulosonate cytidylyltransferase (CMP-KDO synthetase)
VTIKVNEPSILFLIPARYQSTRLPGKPLILLAGKVLVDWVVLRTNEAITLLASRGIKAQVAVVSDHDLIEQKMKELGHPVIRVDDDVPSGSERLNLAFQRHFKQSDWQLIVNVQGDEPLVEPQALVDLVETHLDQRGNFDLMTMVVERQRTESDFGNPNRVKVAYIKNNHRCLYFSRAAIPFDREGSNEAPPWYYHVGVYSYIPQALLKFCSYAMGEIENLEKLEQLRALENGMAIGAIQIDKAPHGVDTPEDVTLVEGVLRG